MTQKRILVADDDAVSRNMLARYLERWGYQVHCVVDGDEAWQALAADNGYHVALLDWQMPGLSGVDLCRKIRESDLAMLYLILITGRAEKEDMVMGLEAGADDYVIKPFDPAALSSRLKVGCRLVDSGLLLQEKNRELNRYAKEMESLAEERSRMLIHADRLASLGTLTAGVAHEINNPTTFISGNAQTLQRCWPLVEEVLRKEVATSPHCQKLQMLLDEMPGMLRGIRTGVSRITTIVNGLETFSRVGKNAFETVQVNTCIDEALLLCANRLKYRVQITREFHKTLPLFYGDPQKLEQIFVNLFVNAADAIEEKYGPALGTLTIRTDFDETHLRVTVTDDGIGIPEQNLKEIWQPFFTTKQVGKGTGLGLAISQGIVHDHGGTIRVSSGPAGGACFEIRLPRQTQAVVDKEE